jgi:phage-related protein
MAVAFDAGSIVAHLDIDLDAFDRSLKRAEAMADAAERKSHKIKLSAVFEDADTAKAKRAFQQLDTEISRDALQRMKSSPQGSLFGTLMSLLSPHQMAGGPTASQSASQGGLARLMKTIGAESSGTSGAGLGSLLGGLLGRGRSSGGAEGGEAASGLSGLLSSLGGGIGPGIGGISGMQATLAGAGGLALAALPAAGALGIGGLVAGGGAALAISGSKQLQKQAKSVLSGLQAMMQQAASPLVAPLKAAFAQIPGFVKSIAPALHDLFAGAAPLIAPMLSGLENLVKAVLPGMVTLVKAALPAFQMFAGFLGTLGKDLGGMFSAFAGAVRPSAVILGGLLDVIGGLLPVLGKIAAILAAALAPAFSVLGQTVKVLSPSLLLIGRIFAELAGAVIGDLVSAFSALARFVADLAPSFSLLAKVLGTVFSTLENVGLAAELGDALENMAGPLARLVNVLVAGLVPVLPSVVRLFGGLAGVLTSGMATAVGAVADALAAIVKAVPPGVMTAIADAVVATVVAFKSFALIQGLITGVTAAVEGLAAVMSIDTIALKAMYAWDLLVTVATRAWALAQGILNAIMDMNPFVAIGLAVAVLAVLITKYHKQIWDVISSTWGKVGSFIKSTWNEIWAFAKQWWPLLLGPAGLIAKYHEQIWGFIQNIWHDVRNFLVGTWDQVWADAKNIWGAILAWFATLPTRIVEQLSGLGEKLESFAVNALDMFWDGAKSVGSDVLHWFEGFGSDILGVVKKVLGIFSPSSEFRSIGKNLILGLLHGLQSGMPQVHGAVTALGTSVLGWIKQALAATGMPMSWLPYMEKLVGFESGGNPRAENPQTAGSSGEHAEGIAQTIPSTFAAYGLGGSIWNPVANLIASLRYIKAVYGSPQNIPGIGNNAPYGGYDSGGWLPPGATIAVNQTGMREAVLTPVQSEALVRLASGMAGGGSKLADSITFQMPEGATIAQAMQELTFRVRAAQNAGYYPSTAPL